MKVSDTTAPVLAMVMIVRNEARFLRAHLAYHHHVGIRRCYLFLHQCEDESESIAREFPWVTIIRLLGEPHGPLNYISEIHRLAMDHALGRAREDRVDWLLIIDADEFACAGSLTGDEQGVEASDNHLATLFKGVSQETIQVRLSTKELLPMRLYMTEPFYKNDV